MKLKKLTLEQKLTRKKILEISYISNFSHLGSCLSAVDLIDAVYEVKEKEDKFILSNGHAGVALYAILEKNGLIDRASVEKLYVHPDRNPALSIDVSTGSLGQGLPIAVGMALADRTKSIYCMISDGEISEGSIWEALRIASEQKLTNLKIILNANGWGAYGFIPLQDLPNRFKAFGLQVKMADGHNLAGLTRILKAKVNFKPLLLFGKTTVEQLPFLNGQDAHYFVMKEGDYKLGLELLQ